MNFDNVRDALRAEPFIPFALHLADGRALSVQHPELLARIGEGRYVIVTHADTESYEVVDLGLVTSIERRIKANGHGPKSKRKQG